MDRLVLVLVVGIFGIILGLVGIGAATSSDVEVSGKIASVKDLTVNVDNGLFLDMNPLDGLNVNDTFGVVVKTNERNWQLNALDADERGKLYSLVKNYYLSDFIGIDMGDGKIKYMNQSGGGYAAAQLVDNGKPGVSKYKKCLVAQGFDWEDLPAEDYKITITFSLV